MEAPYLESRTGSAESAPDGIACEDMRVETDKYPDLPVALVSGRPDLWAEVLDWKQGDNPHGFHDDCGLVSAANVCTMAGDARTEEELIAYAAENGLCTIFPDDPEHSGLTTADQLSALLDHYGIDTQSCPASECTYERMAEMVETGHGMILGYNNSLTKPGFEDRAIPDAYGEIHMDHWVCVTGTVRDADTGLVAGFVVCDGSGAGNAQRFLSTDDLDRAFREVVGGQFVVTSAPTHMDGRPLA